MQVDDRLVLEEELAALERAVDVVLEAQPLAQLLLHARLEHDVAPLAGGFRVVHRDVGVAQQLLGVVAGLRKCDADAGRRCRYRRRRAAAARRMTRVIVAAIRSTSRRLVDALEQDRELVAAEARDGVGGARATCTSRCAAACSSRSPASWPSESLTFLKLSRSRNMHRDASGACAAPASSACCTRSRNRLRFASSVSGSWNASWRSCSSSALRSLTSRKLSARPVDGRVVEQVAADALEREAPRAVADGQLRPGRPSGPASPRLRRGSWRAARGRPRPRGRARLRPTRSSGHRPNVRSDRGRGVIACARRRRRS